ncbi:hypothetical protein [Rhizobium phage RHph_X2_24]|nr:hypothetical protein [Rhizobium phage RHph_X2_24]
MTDQILQEENPTDEYSFDALELADAINLLAQKAEDEPFVPIWVRQSNGMIYRITKSSIAKNDDGEYEIYLDVE